MEPIRVGVVGFGLGGRIFHAAVIDAVEGLELAAIVQRSGKTAAEAYPRVKIVSSVDELLEDTGIRLVAVSTPTSTHFPIARQCLLADRDVVIDKPLAMDSSQTAELIRLARARKRLLGAYQNRRWDGDFRTVRHLLQEGELGRLVQFESHFDRFRPHPNLASWHDNGTPGGGLTIDLGPHLVDQAVVLFGLPHSVWANIRVDRDGGRMDDAFDICLRYPASPEAAPDRKSPAGLTVWLRSTCLARDPEARFTLNGTRGTYRKFGLDPQEDTLRRGDLFATSPWGMEAPEHWGTLTVDDNGHAVSRRIPTEAGDYRSYYANVRDALLGKADLEVTSLDAWRTMRILDLAVQSSQSGRAIPCDWTEQP